jgi:hypothetical protein
MRACASLRSAVCVCSFLVRVNDAIRLLLPLLLPLLLVICVMGVHLVLGIRFG